jgi:hypothetical protein
LRLEPLGGFGQPLWICVGKCNDLDIWQFGKWHIDRMPIIPSARCSNYSNSVLANTTGPMDPFESSKNSTCKKCALEVAST